MRCKFCGISVTETLGKFVHTPAEGLFYIFCRCQCAVSKTVPCCCGESAAPVEQIA